MPGVLLDTHAFYWLMTGAESLANEALVAIGECQRTKTLFVSPISAWELSIAAQKPAHKDRLRLPSPISTWFRAAIRATSAKIAPIGQNIAVAAAEVAASTGHKDPGDCYLMATSKIRKLSLITRDQKVVGLAADGYLAVIVC